MTKRGLFFGAMGLLALGCQDDLVINSERQPILGGTAAPAGKFDTVVGIVLNAGQGGLCTGSLIAPDVVLTAAHCIDGPLAGISQAQVAPNTFVIFDSTNLFNQNQGFAVGASQVIQHPQHPNFQNPGELGQHDVGIIILDTPVTDRAPSTVELNPNRNLIGTTTTQVGYGLTNPANQNSAGSLFFVDNNIDGCGQFGLSDTPLICFNQQDGKGSCSGDSGGPLFEGASAGLSANPTVLGVTSFGDQGCAVLGAYTRLSFEADFIQPFLDGTPPDCSANNLCNAICPPGDDPDCADCDDDGTCVAACGQAGNPEDPDCEGIPPGCGVDGQCNQNCVPNFNFVDPDCACSGFNDACDESCGQNGLAADPDCEGGFLGRRCSVDPVGSSTSSSLPIAALFGLFAAAVLFSRRRS